MNDEASDDHETADRLRRQFLAILAQQLGLPPEELCESDDGTTSGLRSFAQELRMDSIDLMELAMELEDGSDG